MKKIFVVGCPRSGTTLIQKLLGSNDFVFTCKETQYFLRIRRTGIAKILDYLLLSKKKVMNAFEFIRINNNLIGEYDPKRVNTPRSATVFFDHVMTLETQARGKLAWVEKTPAHLFSVRWIKRYIPSALFVHVLRDGRDVVASMVDAARKYPNAKAWKRHVDLETVIDVYNHYLNESKYYYGCDGHIFVNYEHFLDNPNKATDRLFGLLGLQGQYSNRNFASVHVKVVRSDEDWKNELNDSIEDTRLIKFNKIFNEDEKNLVISRLKTPTSKTWGYSYVDQKD